MPGSTNLYIEARQLYEFANNRWEIARKKTSSQRKRLILCKELPNDKEIEDEAIYIKKDAKSDALVYKVRTIDNQILSSFIQKTQLGEILFNSIPENSIGSLNSDQYEYIIFLIANRGHANERRFFRDSRHVRGERRLHFHENLNIVQHSAQGQSIPIVQTIKYAVDSSEKEYQETIDKERIRVTKNSVMKANAKETFFSSFDDSGNPKFSIKIKPLKGDQTGTTQLPHYYEKNTDTTYVFEAETFDGTQITLSLPAEYINTASSKKYQKDYNSKLSFTYTINGTPSIVTLDTPTDKFATKRVKINFIKQKSIRSEFEKSKHLYLDGKVHYGKNEHSDERDFMITPNIHGETLRNYITRTLDESKNPDDFSYAVKSIVGNCIKTLNAVNELYEKGMYHGDIKVGNTIIVSLGMLLLMHYVTKSRAKKG